MENPPFGRLTVNRNHSVKFNLAILALYRILPLPVNLFLRLHREKAGFS